MRWFVLCILTVLALSFSLTTLAADNSPLTPQAISDLHTIGDRLATVSYLTEQELITIEEANTAEEKLLADAAIIYGQSLTADELATITSHALPAASLTSLQRFAGLITFTNILWTIAIVLGVICFCILFWRLLRFLLTIILAVPPEVYEVSLGFIGLGLIGDAYRQLAPGVREYVAFTGCLLFGGALGIAYVVHKLDRFKCETAIFSALAVVAAASAILNASSLSGFLAIASLMSALGFSAVATPLCYAIGFRNDEALGRATSVALLMVALFVGLKMTATIVPWLEPFQIGALYLGSFIGYLGLLIASSYWYATHQHDKQHRYILMQVVTVIAGLAALAIGSMWNIPELRSIGGTFFIIYLVEKFMEIPSRSLTGWAFKGLCVSAGIYGLCLLIKTYPEMLRPYLLF